MSDTKTLLNFRSDCDGIISMFFDGGVLKNQRHAEYLSIELSSIRAVIESEYDADDITSSGIGFFFDTFTELADEVDGDVTNSQFQQMEFMLNGIIDSVDELIGIME